MGDAAVASRVSFGRVVHIEARHVTPSVQRFGFPYRGLPTAHSLSSTNTQSEAATYTHATQRAVSPRGARVTDYGLLIDHLQVQQQVALRTSVDGAVKRGCLSCVHLHTFDMEEVRGAH